MCVCFIYIYIYIYIGMHMFIFIYIYYIIELMLCLLSYLSTVQRMRVNWAVSVKMVAHHDAIHSSRNLETACCTTCQSENCWGYEKSWDDFKGDDGSSSEPSLGLFWYELPNLMCKARLSGRPTKLRAKPDWR